ncbi:type I 3-dehydroquinate dehydratase [Demequina sediminicola]|uniref:type I 3-dehydroquinate dehydratase n=1 Tax=Demequina sediminicola TaxID=1095026 RepID=UPI000782785F|nr:type I 3-dehydroquinate dehydratase [Demequina sediminicola]
MSGDRRVSSLFAAESPAVIVPVMGESLAEARSQFTAALQASPDVIEWRIDPLIAAGVAVEDVMAGVTQTHDETSANAESVPLLVTLRTAGEGGLADVTDPEYCSIVQAVLASGAGELVDIEMARSTADSLVADAHGAGRTVVGSRHHFDGTPTREQIVATLRDVAERGADIPKIAVMPHTATDVVTLLAATEEASGAIEQPIITMSMGSLGVVSRVAGGVFGSAATFAMVGQPSAPGQVEIARLRDTMAVIRGA